jgi:hypothetical protein
MSHAAKIEAQGGHAQRLQRLGDLKDNFIMHSSAAQGMWMTDERRVTRPNAFFFGLEDTFQMSRRRWDIYV